MKGCLRFVFYSLYAIHCYGQETRVASKPFTEGYVLAEIVAQVLEHSGERVERKFGLGATGVIFEALRREEIDLYPEYTGTIAEAILKRGDLRSLVDIRQALVPLGLVITDSLGFSNTYAVALKAAKARQLSLLSITDLAKIELRAGFSHEFLKRDDGFPKLKAAYGVRFASVRGLEHSLIYEALETNTIDVADIYSTDAKLQKFGLVTLKDDKGIFPDYSAVVLARAGWVRKNPAAWNELKRLLEGRIAEGIMIKLNAEAELENKNFSQIAETFLYPSGETKGAGQSELWILAGEHLRLVTISLLASTFVGIPLGVMAWQYPLIGQGIFLLSGVVQTIPSIALLCFLIPFFGIGALPALVALFLYGLLPIMRGTYTGIQSIDPKLIEVSKALGLSFWNQLRFVKIPLASVALLGGIKTSAIIGVGTTTLASFIGAGGLGVKIVTGLALNHIPTILEGAVPAAMLAGLMHILFEILERLIVPRGLRLPAK